MATVKALRIQINKDSIIDWKSSMFPYGDIRMYVRFSNPENPDYAYFYYIRLNPGALKRTYSKDTGVIYIPYPVAGTGEPLQSLLIYFSCIYDSSVLYDKSSVVLDYFDVVNVDSSKLTIASDTWGIKDSPSITEVLTPSQLIGRELLISSSAESPKFIQIDLSSSSVVADKGSDYYDPNPSPAPTVQALRIKFNKDCVSYSTSTKSNFPISLYVRLEDYNNQVRFGVIHIDGDDIANKEILINPYLFGEIDGQYTFAIQTNNDSLISSKTSVLIIDSISFVTASIYDVSNTNDMSHMYLGNDVDSITPFKASSTIEVYKQDYKTIEGVELAKPKTSSQPYKSSVYILSTYRGEVRYVTNNLSNCTTNNISTQIYSNDGYSATVTADEGYCFDLAHIDIRVGDEIITPTIAQNLLSFSIDIPSPILHDISINAQGKPRYTVTNHLTRCVNNNTSTIVGENDTYTATITAENNYFFGNTLNVNVTMNGEEITPTFTQDLMSFTISIPSVTGDIVISARAIWYAPAPEHWSASWVPINTTEAGEYYVVSSSIKQTSDSIELKVSKGDVSSQLSIESDQIRLESGRLIIESGNFQIDEDGYITAKGATLSGNLTCISSTSNSSTYIDDGTIQFNYNDVETCIIKGNRRRYSSGYNSVATITGDRLLIESGESDVWNEGTNIELNRDDSENKAIKIRSETGIYAEVQDDFEVYYKTNDGTTNILHVSSDGATIRTADGELTIGMGTDGIFINNYNNNIRLYAPNGQIIFSDSDCYNVSLSDLYNS